MTTAYFDCFSGISGDMTVAALLDLGVPLNWLQDQLQAMSLDGFSLTEETIDSNGIHARRFNVTIKEENVYRNYNDIKSIVTNSTLPSNVQKISLAVFDVLAMAESQIHGIDKHDVHFHEVGAVDSIVDIVGTALCLEYLGIDTILSSKIPLGKGFVNCRHGMIPVPAPATLEILKDVPVYGTAISGEIVTPTGAAILKSLASDFVEWPRFCIEKIGYGAGTRDLGKQPNLLRVVTGQLQAPENHAVPSPSAESIVVLETCIDDMNPEIFSYLMECLFQDGALDAYWIPVFMKKNRPGTLVQVLCKPDDRSAIIDRILSETTTTGVRFHTNQRMCLERNIVTISTEFGEIEVKRITELDGSTRLVPEHEACKRIARDHGMPIQNVYDRIARTSRQPND